MSWNPSVGHFQSLCQQEGTWWGKYPSFPRFSLQGRSSLVSSLAWWLHCDLVNSIVGLIWILLGTLSPMGDLFDSCSSVLSFLFLCSLFYIYLFYACVCGSTHVTAHVHRSQKFSSSTIGFHESHSTPLSAEPTHRPFFPFFSPSFFFLQLVLKTTC